MSLPGSAPLGGLLGQSGVPQLDPQQQYEQKIIKFWQQMQGAFDSCPAKSVMAGTMGFGLGGMFGLFMSSMRYDTPMSANSTTTFTSLPVREQLRTGLKDMGKASWSSAKNFGLVGAIFSGTECCIEGLRATNDLSNGVSAGCITGGVLARNGGPQAVAVGCIGFAAFSAAIDSYMRMPNEGKGGPIE